MVLVINESHIVLPDFLTVLELMYVERKENYDSTQLICLGSKQESNYSVGKHFDKVEIVAWQYNYDILAFDKFFWQRLKSCSDFFCNFNDSNWNWSLENVNRKCLKSNLKTMLSIFPRIISQTHLNFHEISKVRFVFNYLAFSLIMQCRAQSCFLQKLRSFMTMKGT